MSSKVKQIKNALINLLASESQGGRLNGVEAVGGVAYNENSKFPYIGVELVHKHEEVSGTLERIVHCVWGVVIAVRSKTTLEAAYEVRDNFVDDGNGNGVEPILRGLSSSLMGGLLMDSYLDATDYASNYNADKGAANTGHLAFAQVYLKTQSST